MSKLRMQSSLPEVSETWDSASLGRLNRLHGGERGLANGSCRPEPPPITQRDANPVDSASELHKTNLIHQCILNYLGLGEVASSGELQTILTVVRYGTMESHKYGEDVNIESRIEKTKCSAGPETERRTSSPPCSQTKRSSVITACKHTSTNSSET
jgi:hypothetical protein